MLKKRIIPALLLKNNRMVKGVNFNNYRDTGNPKTAVRIYSSQDADELIFIDILRNNNSKNNLVDFLNEVSTECSMPLTAGGGIKNENDVRELINAGADKVIINTAAYENPKMISNAVTQFGSQCIIGGIDYRLHNSKKTVFINCGKSITQDNPVDYAKKIEDLGVGEIYLNSIDLDGTMKGYDIDIVQKISDKLSIPLIASGGAGNFMHLVELFNKTNVSAVACASLFHFGDNNPIRARSYLKNNDIPMRRLK